MPDVINVENEKREGWKLPQKPDCANPSVFELMLVIE